MATKPTFATGAPLEARVQRLFMCQGAFAERDLFVRAARGSAKMVTDVDVVAHDYNLNFYHRRLYAECKGGKNKSVLDRVVWVRGVKEMIGADHPHLVIDHCDPASVQFARTLGVEILQAAGLNALESALRIGPTFWPGRANLAAYQPIEESIKRITERFTAGDLSEWLAQASEIWRDASALAFSYGKLNSLLGAIESCSALAAKSSPDATEACALRYASGALLVRLSQYVLFAASDTLAMAPSEREQYLAERLTAGGLELEQSRRILEGALKMAAAHLRSQRIEPPATWTVDHMLSAPAYTKPFVTIVERVIADGEKSRLLPLAMEMRLFGFGGDEAGSARMVARMRQAIGPTGLVIGFARQSLGLPESLSCGPASDIAGVTVVSHGRALTSPPAPQAETTGPDAKEKPAPPTDLTPLRPLAEGRST
jgi:hypothetical protein